jgi:hypothetical protein
MRELLRSYFLLQEVVGDEDEDAFLLAMVVETASDTSAWSIMRKRINDTILGYTKEFIPKYVSELIALSKALGC